ncbi:hypothetical protein NHP21005_01060 [Helicobacter sp. NHP21005]|uniref:tetratricopeptide repeat protein n=1 Tax=Helicobacter felistomachi TaxID=3040201 RepID=UPI002572AD87|nr:tetratricopeptide repeat protein [Helicobacter sp. NHP21005]BEG56418.1 hypothetical protein NHP21005_01060 [Helicobacter sp. NHP21005]
MFVFVKKRVWQVVLLWAVALGVCYANSQADEYYKLAKSYNDSKDYSKSIAYWKKLIDMGDARGYNGMGYMYNYGHGVVKDISKALQYFQKAADMGDATAYYNLGNMYLNGEGVEKDYSKALQYFQKAADMGDATAYYNLGNMYLNGEGVEKDYSKALQYFQKAADMGDAWAYNNLGVMYSKGEGVGQDTEAARRYYKKACDLGNQVGCNNLKALAPKHVAYKLNFDIQKKEVDLFGEGLGTLIEITSKNRDPVRLEGIIINEGNSCNDWNEVMADGRPARGNRRGYVLKYSQGYMIGVSCLPYKILSVEIQTHLGNVTYTYE